MIASQGPAFRGLAVLEGLSLLLLVGIAVPLKHLAGIREPVRFGGLVHGLLFLLYEAALFEAYGDRRRTLRATLLAALAAFVPGGTFVVAWQESRKG